jgi:hypothetical protein
MRRVRKVTTETNQPKLRALEGKGLAISQACNFLRQAEVRNCGLLSNGSNYVFLVKLVKAEMEVRAIYKPRQGEAPLWDFPDGTLYKREYAAFVVCEALEWRLVPPTVVRNGPYGVGSMQWFIDVATETSHQSQLKDTVLKEVALFDYLVNNADRKLGHFLIDTEGRLWIVDHGLTFNAAPKLRTVLWDFAGQTIPDELLEKVRALRSELKPHEQLRDTLLGLLNEPELKALDYRIEEILERPVFVYPGPNRSVPWPLY